MAVRSMETTKTTMETNGDGSGGTSPSRQGAGSETSVPQNSSSTVAELRNSSRNFADCFRVFATEALNRQRGGVRGGTRRPHHGWAPPGAGPRLMVVSLASAPPWLSFGPRPSSGKNGSLGLRFVQFREYFMYSFSETQK
jgi:hypothetical protein